MRIKQGKKSKATIVHTIKNPKKSGNWNLLTTYAILKTLPDNQYSRSWVYRAKVLQGQVRFQMYRWITENPDRAYPGTYELNCPPSGLLVKPVTRFCNNPLVCPWCYVRRRLIPIYEAIREIPRAQWKGYKIVAIRYISDASHSDFTFFRRDRGPHQWCKALVTTQTVTPFPVKDEEDLKIKEADKRASGLEHVFHLVQVVPKDVDVLSELLRRGPTSNRDTYEVTELPFTSLTNVIRVLSGSYQLPWLQLFSQRNLTLFSNLKSGFSKHRLLRINPYKTMETK
jgi:hypothetical protein|tara:strand:+ start:317 stop:1168 length:852 start_codon:yes stop_codon:yes gene_type:complete